MKQSFLLRTSLMIAALLLPITALAQVTVLMQSDFDNGTYRITEPGNYKLGEDIVMHPNPENDFRPYNLFPGQPQYESHPPQPFGFYDLGFFAGITIETCDVTLNFDGHTFSQSDEFVFAQRFFETVMVSDDPFLPRPGTPNQLVAACNTTIKNGKIDNTSHIGIGGLGASNITIKDMEISNFAVAGINIGGGHDITIKDVLIKDALPISGIGEGFRVASAQFARVFLGIQCQAQPTRVITIADQPAPVAICDLLDELNHQLDLVERYTIDNDQSVTSDPSWAEAEATYITGFDEQPSGVVYGIFMQALESRAFHQFPDDQPIDASEITIKDVKIENLRNTPVEVIGLEKDGVGLLKNPATDIVRIQDISSDFNPDLSAGTNYYKGRNLENAILAVMLTETFPGSTGGAVFTPELLDWMSSKPAKTLAEALGENDDSYSVVCNADGNGHLHKGLLGIRIDSTDDVLISDVEISELENSGDVGSSICGPYEGENGLGYLGADTRGIGLFSSINVKVKNVEIEELEATARVIGVDLKNSTHVDIKDSEIEELFSTSTTSPGVFPNLVPHACGVTGDANAEADVNNNVDLEDISALAPCPDELVPGGSGSERLNGTIDQLVKEQAGIPDAFEIYQNYPNPFNPVTVITYAMPEAADVTIKVYDTLGKEVSTLVNGRQQAGHHSVTFDAARLPAGVYFYTVRSADFVKTQRMTLLK